MILNNFLTLHWMNFISILNFSSFKIDKDETIVEYGNLHGSGITGQDVENVGLSIVLVLVRGGVRLLVVGVDVLLVVLAVLVVGVVLPVAVLHHLALRQVRRTLNKLREPAAIQQMYTENAKSFS